MSQSELSEAQDQSTDPSRLVELAASKDPHVRGGVAKNAASPVEILAVLAGDDSLGVARDVAQNPSAPEEALISLASDSDVALRVLVAENPSTPVEVLTALSSDPELIVRGAVGSNPSTPIDLLAALAVDENSEVRGGVVVNPLVTAMIEDAEQSKDLTHLPALAQSVFPWVRAAAAANPSMDPARLTELATTDEEQVRRCALLNAACPNEVREASGLIFMFAIKRADFASGRTNMMVTSRDFTRDLASARVEVLYSSGSAEDYEVMRAAGVFGGDEVVARPSNEMASLVWCGSGAPDWWSNWALIEDFLGSGAVAALARGDESLFEDNEITAAERVAFAGHEASEAAWVQIRADLGTVFATGECSEWGLNETVPSMMSSSQELSMVANRWLKEDSWRKVSDTAHRAVLSALARHPNTPTVVLEELAVSDQESVRWLVTRNASATDEIRAVAVLMGVDDERFIKELPGEDWMDVTLGGVHVGVHASAWTREEFAERFPDVFEDAGREWVTSGGEVAIDSRICNLPGRMTDYLDDALPRSYEATSGSVIEFEVL